MTQVVERCPSCGVEHEWKTSGECEACDAELRPWCRLHSREIGWLQGLACPRCAEEAARPRPAPPPPGTVPPARPAPEPPPWPARSPRELLPVDLPQPEPPGRSSLAVMLRTALGGLVAGAVGGWMLAAVMGGNPRDTAYWGAWIVGMGGLVVGMIRAMDIEMGGDAYRD